MTFASYKNSYLQLEPIVNPRIINRSVQAARDVICIDEHDLNPPFNRLLSEQPPTPACCDHEWVQPLSYGRDTFLQLGYRLDNLEDVGSLLDTLDILQDLVKDPEKTSLAIDYKLLVKLADLLFHIEDTIKEKTFAVLTVMAQLGFCKDLIIENVSILEAIESSLISDNIDLNLKCLEFLEVITARYDIVDTLVNMGILKLVLSRRLIEDEDVIIFAKLNLLRQFLYCSGTCAALRFNLPDNLVDLLNHQNIQIIVAALDCLRQLLSTKMGRSLTYRKAILKKLIAMLYIPETNLHKAAAGVLMNLTLKAKIKILIYNKHPYIVQRLIELAMQKQDANLQIFAVQTMVNLGEFPKMAKLLYQFYDRLKMIPVEDNQNLAKFKTMLTSEVYRIVNL